MKLVFPNGEHGQVLLNPGVNRVGSSVEGAVVLDRPGIQYVHCEVHVVGQSANVQVPAGGGPVLVNGKKVTDLMALRNGDQLAIGSVIAKFVMVEAARSASSSMSSGGGPEEDSGATRVRTAVPKYVLRGVSGAVFSKVFPITGPVVIGRAAECDISVPADEISRRHALVKPTPDGLSVEDLGSSNGTYVNGKRLQQGFLNPGDELRLDAVRFILVAPGMEMPTQPMANKPKASTAPAAAGGGQAAMMKWAVVMVAVAALIMMALLIFKK